jgi:hypothetical protein
VQQQATGEDDRLKKLTDDNEEDWMSTIVDDMPVADDKNSEDIEADPDYEPTSGEEDSGDNPQREVKGAMGVPSDEPPGETSLIDDEVPQAAKRPIDEGDDDEMETHKAKKSRVASIMAVMETSKAKIVVRRLE